MSRAFLVSCATLAFATIATALPPEGSPGPAPSKASIARMEVGEGMPISSKNTAALEAFRKGRDAAENLRVPEAQAQLRRAIELDPGFALAHAYLGNTTPGPEGVAHLERASGLAAKASEAERVLIQSALAGARGDGAKSQQLALRLAELAPRDWHAQFLAGQSLLFSRQEDKGITYLQKAVALNPAAGPAHNLMGYAYLRTGRTEQGIAAFRKYAEVNANEPNPHDSLGEALLKAGRYEEAEQAFARALDVDRGFYYAHSGIAQARFLRGDGAGGFRALEAARDAAPGVAQKVAIDQAIALSHAGLGNVERALQLAAEAERRAQGEAAPYRPQLVAMRAGLLDVAGRYGDAITASRQAIEEAEKAKLPGFMLDNVRQVALGARIDAEARLHQPAAAEKSLQTIEELGRSDPTNSGFQSLVQFGRGSVAIARGDAKSAAQHFARCNDQDAFCRLRRVQALQKAGDTRGAETAREELLAANLRVPIYLLARNEVRGEVATGKSK
ncbi:MAG: tetratricopeptide repeat protein [Acidobacteria bacterium]|nr:tetratricopeptide repeat protein [Acidobacteriota bacterium]